MVDQLGGEFSMTAKTLFKIGDIAKQTSVSVGTLRYYETQKLLHPAERRENGYATTAQKP